MFSKKTSDKKTSKSSLQAIQPKSLDDLFEKHFYESSYFKENAFETVIKHLRHEIDLNKSGEKLTAEEKRELGLNSRLSITSDLVAVLSESGLDLPSPKEALKQVYYRATFEANRIENFNKMLSAGIEQATYTSCGDERDCGWCKANSGVKFKVSEALNAEINQGCSCDWNRGFFKAEINFEK
ncbi:hypothetical protein DEB41_17255 [Vibrio anguillarum]|uniref:Uncharacterized protein n=11 Tax=Vibrio anguillarum TaxID=55601 RepID=A0AAW4AQM1_VIBAN|nr:hypothetical protein N175_18775 [Vibrio anguillarum M3]ASF93771.1 hypothetical protein CEA93_17330 [Vibrio anguillarum]ATA51349.1 hypothetical protein CLI14_16975 [Vibrio anguillarum]AVT65708.1 hypothetical protein B5S57_00435 [Vibrio anguillarum]AXN09235.1 hypothetical protein DEA53_17460 [Vibrio anguillarum]